MTGAEPPAATLPRSASTPSERDLFGLPRESAHVGDESGLETTGQLTLFETAEIVAAARRPDWVRTTSADTWRWVRPRPSGVGGGGTGAATGQLLRARRESLGLSQVVLAARLGVAQSVVSRVEGGRVALTLDDLCEWAAVLEADLVSLLGDETSTDGMEIRRPRDPSLRVSTALARSVPAASVDDVASVGVSIRRLVLAQQSLGPLMPNEARALIRAGFADGQRFVAPLTAERARR